ncbi:Rrf2 family transcriptional regulator [Limnohabitans sp. MMS-10A-178]|uniref:Rrf2 family transcriptional regulator n=1 Tax=Limnohabitans sp. MMS-10A-178 TaxID=1835767 RepID=UPI000D35F542|nr:Rrf2 family transcriptional regulator [Limnohabitans sp. MMS-10A-178]PUE13667.1 DNA-binding protein [Limnohabitans sp. MMS-10A-178]
MRLSTKSRFAVTAMIDVALREDRGPVSLSAISERHQISLSYLEQLFSKLRQHHLVESTRGPGGGYSLARNAEKITMADIVSAVDFSSDSEEINSEANNWMSSELWASLNEKMLAHLQSISLRQLVSEQRAKGITVEPAPSVVKRGVFAKPKSQPVKMNVPNSVFALATSLVPTR